MAKQKPTKKEIETVVSGIINHLRFIEEKIGALDSLFGLYLQWKGEQDKFNEFVKSQIEKNSKKNVENEPGETK